jgi:aminoglycoside 6'-N-acetyltransferase I
MTTVRRARQEDAEQLAALRALLWPAGAVEEHRAEVEALLATGVCGTMPAAVFVAEDADGALVGFLEAGLRSYAEGCDRERPVGYVEGWFVREGHRMRGVGRSLLEAAEEWMRKQRCREMASDAPIENGASHAAHEALGFAVVERCVHFRKPL